MVCNKDLFTSGVAVSCLRPLPFLRLFGVRLFFGVLFDGVLLAGVLWAGVLLFSPLFKGGTSLTCSTGFRGVLGVCLVTASGANNACSMSCEMVCGGSTKAAVPTSSSTPRTASFPKNQRNNEKCSCFVIQGLLPFLSII
jgi:hypothetical protein